MSHPTKPLIQTIHDLTKKGLMTETLFALAEKSPTKFMRDAIKILTEDPGFVRKFTFKSYDKDCTLYIDIRWIPVIKTSAHAFSANKILAIKGIRCVAGYAASDAVAFDANNNPCSFNWQNNSQTRNGAGLADAKSATEGGIPGIF